MKRRREQVAGRFFAAVGNRVEKTFAPIPGGVKSHRKPQVASTSQGQAEEQADQCGAAEADPVLSGIPEMNSAESHRTQNSRGPEANTLGQHRLRISAKEQFLLQPHQQEYASPECGKLYQTSAMQND